MHPSPCRSSVLGIALLIVLFAPVMVLAQYYEQDFDNTQFKDPANTTAYWNTTSGRLELPLITLSTIGSHDSSGKVWDARVAGNYLYVADGTAGLRVLRITDPTAPVDVGGYDTSGDTRSVDIEGNTLYIADGSLGLRSFDITDPDAPASLGMYNTPGFAWKVSVYGNLAAVADLSSLLILDVSNPTIPVLLGSIATPGNCRDVVLDGDYAYTAQDGAGLYIYDISDPTSPSYCGANTIPDRALGLCISGEYAFVADHSDGLRIFDIGNRASPVLRGSYDTPNFAQRVFVSGDEAYIADFSTGLVVVDITDVTNPTLIATHATGDGALNVSVRGIHAYVSDGDSGVEIVDVGDPAAVCNGGIFDLGGNYPHSTLSGDLCFAADSDGKVEIFDTIDWRNPTPVGSFTVAGGAPVWWLEPAGDLLYVGTHGSGTTSGSVQVLDISNPASPALIGRVDVYKVGQLVPAGDHVWVTTNNTVASIDVSDPTNPFIAGYYVVSPSQCYGLVIEGDEAYVANGTDGLLVLDISDPTAPSYLGSRDTPNYLYHISVAGNQCYTSSPSGDVYFWDIEDPSNPQYLRTYTTVNSVWELRVQLPYLYVNHTSEGVQVLDVTKPGMPVVDHLVSPFSGRGISLNGGIASIGYNSSGVWLYPTLQRHFDASGTQAQSLDLHPGTADVVWIELNATETGEVIWEITADGGTNWQRVNPSGVRYWLSNVGGDLRWRSTFEEPDCDFDLHIASMDLTWRAQGPILQSITDVPGDQGGWVRIAFARSAYDYVDEATWPIQQYFVHRLVEDPSLIAAITERGRAFAGIANAAALDQATKLDQTPSLDGWPAESPLTEWQGRYFTVNEDAAKRVDIWEVVAGAPAMQQDDNLVLAPTLADSTDHLFETTYRISAHATIPSIYFYSDALRGYSVDNIAPGVPSGMTAEYRVSGVSLEWEASLDEDFQYFRVYRASDPNFVPSPRWLVHETAGTRYGDDLYQPWEMYYKVTALDYVGNESPPASPERLTDTEHTPPSVARFALHQNQPNPFNPATMIRYQVPTGGAKVAIQIYDSSGRHLHTLVSGFREAGEHSVSWHGRDDAGSSVASGVYYLELKAADMTLTRKMSLVR